MIDVIYRCDFCESIVTEKEYVDQMIFGKNPLHEWNFENKMPFLICEKCAVKIDYALLKFKMTYSS